MGSSLPTNATAQDWGDDDTCGIPNPPVWYYPTGPLAFWHEATYSGGPPGSGGICTMYTENVQEYVNFADDNTSYWYLPVATNYSGNYGVWAFVPVVAATTTRATYEYWEYGHPQGKDHSYGLCAVDQASIFNAYARLCAATLGHTDQFYFCSDGSVGCGGFFRLVDATGEASLTTYVASDELDYCAQAGVTYGCSPMTAGLPYDYTSTVLSDTLSQNQTLSAGQSLTAVNAAYNLVMQSTGVLQIIGPSGVIWSRTSASNAYALMQSDGNFVIYGQGGHPAYWSTGTQGNTGAHIVMQCDGNLVVYRTNGTAAWNSGTQTGSQCIFE